LDSGWQGKVDAKARAPPGGGIDDKRTLQPGGAFVHAQDAHATTTGRIETHTIVLNGKDYVVGNFPDRDMDMAGVCVFSGVVKGLLNNPVDACFLLVGKIIDGIVDDYVDDEAAAAGNFATLPFECPKETEIVEHGRTKKERYVAHLFGTVLCECLDFLDSAAVGIRNRVGVNKALYIHE
jgi:hypothetical protein